MAGERRTKIIATLGPVSRSGTVMRRLRRAGVDLFRVNISHGAREEQRTLIRRAAATGAQVMIDLCGAKVRVADARPRLPLDLQRGERVLLVSGRRAVSRKGAVIEIAGDVDLTKARPGMHVLLDDGNLELLVTGVRGGTVATVVGVGGRLLPRKGVALPSDLVRVPTLTEEDGRALDDLAGEPFGFVAGSFVRDPEQIVAIRERLRRNGASAKLFAKIEEEHGVANAARILHVSDGLLVARGDLGVSMPLPSLPFSQKSLVRLGNRARKPVVVATQMLESMIEHNRPTRAEVTDVANAVLEGADALMLSGETAVGSYPVETVKMMDQIILRAEEESGRRGGKNRDWVSPTKRPSPSSSRAA